MQNEIVCSCSLTKAKNGFSRGLCTRPRGHIGRHGNETCVDCGVLRNKENTQPSHLVVGSQCCRSCERIRHNRNPSVVQRSGKEHTFPCGCTGILPEEGETNKFVLWQPHKSKEYWTCRISRILFQSKYGAQKYGHKAIPADTPHLVIRKMMEEPNCERCGLPLIWEFGMGKTPHLHHNHETGELYGFTHVWCNPRALEKEIERLKQENKQLKIARR